MVRKIIVVSFLSFIAFGCAKKHEIGPKAKTLADIKKEIDTKMAERKAGGGQPGTITLTGGLVDNKNKKPVDEVSVNLQTGKGKNGQYPAVEIKKMVLTPAKIEYKRFFENVYISMGCKLKNKTLVSVLAQGLREAPLDQMIRPLTSDSVKVTVDRVYMCGKITLPHNRMLIKANSVYMNGVNIEMIGTQGREFLQIEAARLDIDGKNLIASKQPDAANTSDDAPEIKLEVGELGGRGTLAVESYGSNYKP